MKIIPSHQLRPINNEQTGDQSPTDDATITLKSFEIFSRNHHIYNTAQNATSKISRYLKIVIDATCKHFRYIKLSLVEIMHNIGQCDANAGTGLYL